MVKNRLGYVRPNHQNLFRRLCFFKAINDNSPRILHDIHLFQSLIKMHCSRFGILSRAVANGGAGGALDPPTFGQAVNPISTRGGGADYTHFSITSPPPEFQTLRRVCWVYALAARQSINGTLRGLEMKTNNTLRFWYEIRKKKCLTIFPSLSIVITTKWYIKD